MLQKELVKYIRHPETLDGSAIKPLQDLVKNFPYFQGAHILLTLASKKWDTSVYQQTLKRTAIAVTSRSHLFDLLHSNDDVITEGKTVQEQTQSKKELTPAPDAQHELNILKAAEVSVEPKVILPVIEKKEDTPAILEKEIERQVVSAFVEKEIIKTPELHKPVEPVADQPESFGDWLAFLKKNNGQSYNQIEEQVNTQKAQKNAAKAQQEKPGGVPVKEEETGQQESRKLKNKAIIDKIIEKNPGLIRTREEQKFYAPEARAKESLLENEHLMTETLARIYALQGNIGKAVRAYEILSLKYPQKSAYFATLIQQLRNNVKH